MTMMCVKCVRNKAWKIIDYNNMKAPVCKLCLYDFKVGQKVIYNRTSEVGVITSIKGDRIWVRYNHQPLNADGQLTPVETLEIYYE